MPPWLSICAILLNREVAHAALEDPQRPGRVMRTQRKDAGALEISGDAQFSLAEGGYASSSANGVIDAEERDASSEDADFLAPNTTSLHCSDMPSGFCCGLSPKKIRVDTGGDKCVCGGPEEGGKFTSQAAIDQYCSEVVQPCNQLSHVTCCDMGPKMIRHHDGKGQCWCSGPQNDSAHSTQESIDEWCETVIRPCAALSEGHCCHMQPKQIRQGSGDKCWCSGPQKGGEFHSQDLIDAACKEVVKPCQLVPRARCCTMSPKQIRYNDGKNQCWCSGPVVGEAFSSQIAIDEWCQKIIWTTTTTTSRATTTTSTPWLSNLTCAEVSEASCCAKSPKQWRATQINDRCYCAGPNVAGSNLSSQQAIDHHCALMVRPCEQMRQEDCCMSSPSKYLVGDDEGEQVGVGEGSTKMCTCATPLKETRFTEQQAIDAACARLWSPCTPIHKAQCCLSEPALMQEGRGKQCFCAGPHPAGAYKSQKDIDAACSKMVQSCDDLATSDCCLQMPAKVRISDSGQCWCSAPFTYGNLSYSQQQIDFICSSAAPLTVEVTGLKA